MTQEAYDNQERDRLKDIMAVDETRTGILRQIVNGVSGLLLLLVTGLVIVLLVLWKSP
jgi:hypothetical protein